MNEHPHRTPCSDRPVAQPDPQWPLPTTPRAAPATAAQAQAATETPRAALSWAKARKSSAALAFLSYCQRLKHDSARLSAPCGGALSTSIDTTQYSHQPAGRAGNDEESAGGGDGVGGDGDGAAAAETAYQGVNVIAGSSQGCEATRSDSADCRGSAPRAARVGHSKARLFTNTVRDISSSDARLAGRVQEVKGCGWLERVPAAAIGEKCEAHAWRGLLSLPVSVRSEDGMGGEGGGEGGGGGGRGEGGGERGGGGGR